MVRSRTIRGASLDEPREAESAEVGSPGDRDGASTEPQAGGSASSGSSGPDRAAKEPMRFVTIRAMAIACALMPVTALWVVLSEVIWYSSHSTTISLFYHVTFVVFVIALVNLLVRKRWPRSALSAGEIMVIFMMLSIASTFCSHDMQQILVPMLAVPEHTANPQNRWDELVIDRVPSWSIVRDKDAVEAVAVGKSSMYSWRKLKAWSKPLAFWLVFIFALMGALLCINVFFRQPWLEKERLRFPIIRIPMMVAGRLSELLRNRLFWIGFGITAFINTVNGFHHFHPKVPEIPIVRAFSFAEYFVERPWNAIAWTEINLYPFVIGLAFFLPTDLAFSCWFFFVFYQLQRVLTSAVGVHDLPGLPFANEQAAGGYLALGILAIWISRRHLVGVFRTLVGKPGGADDSAEPMRYRTALAGVVGCTGVLIFMGTRLGASWHAMLLFFVIFFIYAIAIARMRAELGPPAHDLHGMGPDVLMHNALGTKAMGDGNMSAFAQFYWFNRAYRAHFSPHCMEGFKIAQQTRILSRSMMRAILVAVFVGAIVGFWAMLHALHVHGHGGRVAGYFGWEVWNRLAGSMNNPQEPRMAATVATGAGFLFALLLGSMRMRFAWWLWHPVGYATSMSWSMGKIWFCIFIGWLTKILITRYGGAASYRKAIPFFVGVVLGEFTVGSLWSIYGAIIGEKVYHFWG